MAIKYIPTIPAPAAPGKNTKNAAGGNKAEQRAVHLERRAVKRNIHAKQFCLSKKEAFCCCNPYNNLFGFC